MRNLFILACAAMNHQKCLDAVKAVYPNARIYQKSGSSFEFIVVDSSGVKEVRTGNFSDANVSGIDPLIEIK